MGGIKIDMKFAINIISLLGAIALLRDEIMEIKSKENGLRTD